jgi:tetratricopeptide (TPR) repeat protein
MGRAALACVMATCAAIAVVAAAEAPARAAPDAVERIRARLREGRKLYDEQEYRKAIRELTPVNRADAATRAQRLEALELIGLSWFILGDETEAREAFEDILAIDAGYELREASGSPKIRAFFQKVKKAYLPDYSPEARVSMEHSAPASGTAGRRLEISVYVTSGQDQIKTVAVTVRRRGMTGYARSHIFRLVKDNHYRARFNTEADNADYVLEYYIQAVDTAGRDLARLGGPEDPLSIPIQGAPNADSGSWTGKWYVWVGAGLAVAGATTAAILLGGESAPDGTLGPPVDLGDR